MAAGQRSLMDGGVYSPASARNHTELHKMLLTEATKRRHSPSEPTFRTTCISPLPRGHCLGGKLFFGPERACRFGARGLFTEKPESHIIVLKLSHGHQADNEAVFHRQSRITASLLHVTPPKHQEFSQHSTALETFELNFQPAQICLAF